MKRILVSTGNPGVSPGSRARNFQSITELLSKKVMVVEKAVVIWDD